MNSNVASLIIAVVGVAGTLLAALLTQRSSVRTKELELKDQREQRMEEERGINLKERRKTYIALNAAVRSYRRAIKNRVFKDTDQTHAQLEQARQEFDHRYAEVQLIAHEEVLKVAYSVSAELSKAFGRVKQFDDDRDKARTDYQAWERKEHDQLIAMLDGPVADEMRLLRKVMRDDLGVTNTT
jgi:hypothetical protein